MDDDIIQLRLTLTIDPTVAQVDSNLKSLLLFAEDMTRSTVSITVKTYPAEDHLHFFFAEISLIFATVTRESVLKMISQSFNISK